MFEKLIDVVLQFIDKVLPFAVVNQTDEGVRLRLGVFKSILKAGFHWKIPFADSIVTNSIVWTTMSLPAQSVTTKDGKSVVVKGIVKYRVSDIQVFVLDVWDAVDAISDMTQGVIFEIVKNKTWAECQSPDLKNVITKKAKVEAKRWGIEIGAVTLSDLDVMRTIRLLTGTTTTV